MNTTLFNLIISGASALILLLLSVIAYFVKSQLEAQKKFNTTNSKEHASIKQQLAIGLEKHKQIDFNTSDIKQLDDRLDKHEIRLVNIEGKIIATYKKV